MAKLLQMKIGLVLLLVAFGAIDALAQEHCSLVLKVVDPNDREVPEAWITAEERNGRVLEAEYKRGGVRFCDLGTLPVKLTVGDPACGGVVLPNVRLDWGETRAVKVVYDRAPCLKHRLPLPVCEILFRFVDDTNNGIPGVVLNPPPPPGLITVLPRSQSDAFGRYHLYVDLKKELRTFAEHDGYEPQEIQLTCTGDLMRHERTVKLQRKK